MNIPAHRAQPSFPRSKPQPHFSARPNSPEQGDEIQSIPMRDVADLEAQHHSQRHTQAPEQQAAETPPKLGYWVKHGPETIGLLGGLALLAYFGGYIGHAISEVKQFLQAHQGETIQP